MANNSDVTIRGLQIAAELNIDASADIISGQLNELATKVNNGSQKLKLNVEVDQEQASVIAKQINTQAQAAQTHVKPVNVDLTFNRGDLVAAEKQIVSLVEKMAAAKDGFSVAGYDTRFNADKTAIDATVSYYEKGSSQILRDHYQLTKGIEGAEDTITLAWTSIGANVKRENDKYIAELNRAANAQDALYQKANAFTSKMSASAFDPNKNTNVLGAGNIDEIRSTYDEIIALRDKLNARGENGQILNSSEIQEAKVQLSDLTIKLTEYIAKAQNASKYAQSMKPVDITAGAIKSMQDVEKLALDIKSAGVNAEYLQKEVANLYTALQTVSTPAGLQTIDEQIKILIADFQIAKKESSIKSREENAKLTVQKKINDEIAKQQEATWKLREEEERRDSAVKKSLASYESQVYYQQKSSEASAYNNKVSERKTALSEYDSFAKSENAEIASLNKQVDAFVAKLKQAGLYTGSFPQDIRALRAEIEGIPSQTILPSGEYVDGIKSKLTGLVGTYDQIISRQQIENEKFQQYYNLVSQKNALEKQLVGVSGNPNKVNEEANIRDRIAAKDKEINDARAKINLSEAQLIKLIAQEQVQREKIGSEQAKVADITEKQRISQQVADRQANAERDRALATLKLMEAQYPKMKGTAFQAQFDGIEQGLQDQTMSGKEANAQLVLLRKNMTAAGLAGQTFGQKFKAAFGKFAQYVSVSTIIFSAIRSVKQMVSEVKELDSAMTQLHIVSGKSTSEIRKFGDEAIQVAKKIGVSATDILKASETYARLGYSLKDAMNLSEYTNIFANIASIDASSATDAITSVMKAYQLDAGDAEHITDILTKVGQEYAVSASELGIALQNGGASLQAANNSLEKSVALIAAGNAAVQDASKVGNALKTTSMRIRGATTAELEDAGADVDGMAESVSKLRDELLALSGVDIQIDENTFKDTYTIILELSKVWDKMSDISQANVLELLAGKRNATVIQSIISNIDDLEGAYASASNAIGTTAEANDIYVNSIEGKQKQLKTSFTEFSDSVVNSDLIKGTFDAGSGILGFLTKLNEAIGGLPTTFGIAGIGMLLKNLGLTRNDGLYTGLSVYKCAA